VSPELSYLLSYSKQFGPGAFCSRGRILLLRSVVRLSLLLLLSRLVGYLEVVLYAEDAGDAVGAHVGHVLVSLRVDHSVEFHFAVLDGDADGLAGSMAYLFRVE